MGARASIMAASMRRIQSIVNGDGRAPDDGVYYINVMGRGMAKAGLIRRARYFVRDDVFIEMLIWRVPASLKGSAHRFKYSLALVADGTCVLRYDNEAGKGDHRHFGDEERHYEFKSIDALVEDFQVDVKGWLNDNPEGEDREP